MRTRKTLWAMGLGGLAIVGMSSAVHAAIMINEADSDTTNVPSTDHSEFIELYSDTGGVTPLDGLAIVLFNGNGNVVYTAGLDLDGQSTNASGYYVIGTTNIAGANNTSLLGGGNILQNGVDGIALFQGDAASFPVGTSLATALGAGTLLDAVVYKTGADVDGVGLAAGLLTAGVEVDEFARDGTAAAGAADSIGRLPNGSGGLRNTTGWTVLTPTPGAANIAAPIPEPASLGVLAVGGLAFLRRRR